MDRTHKQDKRNTVGLNMGNYLVRVQNGLDPMPIEKEKKRLM